MELDLKAADAFLKDCKTPGDVEKLYTKLLQRMINRSLEAELTAHIGHEAHVKTGGKTGLAARKNSRNGSSQKTVQGSFGTLDITTPRDREGSFEPQLIAKRQTRLMGMEDKIIALYARGLTTRDIESALVDLYGITLSHDVISQVTDAVLDEAHQWQQRPLDAVYPIVWLDGIVLKVHDKKQVINKTAHIAFGVNLQGQKEVLGLWLSENESAKYWASVLSELKQRGVRDIFIACMDGLKGLPEAVNALFPETLTQQCLVHLVRAAMRYVPAKDMKAVAADLRSIYTSVTLADAERAMDAFEATWGKTYPAAVRTWRTAWANIVPMFDFPPEIRKITYTTNAIESLNMTIRKYTRNRRIFPNDDAVHKALFMAIQQASKRWGAIHHWKSAMGMFEIYFGHERFQKAFN
jgi:putative transposase